MKRIYIVGIFLIGIAITLLVLAAGDMSTYANFEDAASSGRKVKIVGELAKDKEMYYDPIKDPNFFSFYVRDKDGVEKKVVLLNAKPKDFELSEQIVLTGKMEDGTFMASDMLMKCPSKYKNEEVFVKSVEGQVN